MIDINSIFAVFCEFGPRRAVPLRVRWKNAFPEATSADMDIWEAECGNIEEFTNELSENIFKAKINNVQAAQRLSQRFAGLNPQSIEKALNQAMYYRLKR